MNFKIVVITGAAGGIGQELVHEFIRDSKLVIGIDIQEDNLNHLKELYPTQFIAIKADISKSKEINACCKTILKNYGVPHIWINNAGVVSLAPYLESQQKDFERVININFIALTRFTHFWMHEMNKLGGGTIVNIASMAGYLPLGGMSSYVASKHAVIGFTKSLQQEIEVEKIPVDLLLITPGFVNTAIMNIGEKYGLPKSLEKLTTSPRSCAHQIFKSIKRKDLEYTPTISGKLMRIIHKTSPEIGKKMGKSLLEKVINK